MAHRAEHVPGQLVQMEKHSPYVAPSWRRSSYHEEQRGSATPYCWPWFLPRSGMTSLQGRARGMMECW